MASSRPAAARLRLPAAAATAAAAAAAGLRCPQQPYDASAYGGYPQQQGGYPQQQASYGYPGYPQQPDTATGSPRTPAGVPACGASLINSLVAGLPVMISYIIGGVMLYKEVKANCTTDADGVYDCGGGPRSAAAASR